MIPSVTFATACWEKDWRQILLDPSYLQVKQIANHKFPFAEKLLVINNVIDLPQVMEAAQKKVDEGVLSRYVVAKDVLDFFQLKKEELNDWQYFNAVAPLMAIRECKSDFLLYLTGDVFLEKPVQWIPRAIRCMQKRPNVKVANLTWNDNYREAKKESYRKTWNFYFGKKGFSDQMFLVRKGDFCAPIYGEIRDDSHHFPRGDVFEKRVFSYMLNHGWERITFRRGSYTHENI
ncbi:MAG: hypothetical protein COT85_07345 [Chlamydiae bacterium CG10_big_fil_rev_8_21_14_0_10_42_34]|nr:MAG: hypothetical protein COT85_07345 [Chlamydiae bacterium CG10_big_fil_rev_8_21_14_0_10_42_34]